MRSYNCRGRKENSCSETAPCIQGGPLSLCLWHGGVGAIISARLLPSVVDVCVGLCCLLLSDSSFAGMVWSTANALCVGAGGASHSSRPCAQPLWLVLTLVLFSPPPPTVMSVPVGCPATLGVLFFFFLAMPSVYPGGLTQPLQEPLGLKIALIVRLRWWIWLTPRWWLKWQLRNRLAL